MRKTQTRRRQRSRKMRTRRQRRMRRGEAKSAVAEADVLVISAVKLALSTRYTASSMRPGPFFGARSCLQSEKDPRSNVRGKAGSPASSLGPGPGVLDCIIIAGIDMLQFPGHSQWLSTSTLQEIHVSIFSYLEEINEKRESIKKNET
ncbi:hypothetical protein OsI_29513 [Oryza sativa Indica Group]|uniref:Uncharacterized protein n=1 Tax=Oryza sativa subsp. indica TaxID=39946 RepID=A2YW05_ORYSI|nr:hypothetical protein OsI_29513 [Oryza sativa Indica Group]